MKIDVVKEEREDIDVGNENHGCLLSTRRISSDTHSSISGIIYCSRVRGRIFLF
jgi:hypothetical protein